MKRLEIEKYCTPQLDLAAFLKYSGIEPLLELRHGRVNFVFPVSDELHKLIMRFHSNIEVPIIDYLVAFKTLKGQMLAMRDSHRN